MPMRLALREGGLGTGLSFTLVMLSSTSPEPKHQSGAMNSPLVEPCGTLLDSVTFWVCT